MKSTAPQPGFTFAALTAAGFNALARGDTYNDPESPPNITWDWDERTSRGPRRRPVMHIIGLGLAPDEFAPPPVDADFDKDGSAMGVYYQGDWENEAAATILDAIGGMPLDQSVLIAIWTNGAGHVSVLGADEIKLDPNDPEAFAGVDWWPGRRTPSRNGSASIRLAPVYRSCSSTSIRP